MFAIRKVNEFIFEAFVNKQKKCSLEVVKFK